MKKTLVFDIPTKRILNSNKVIKHYMQKATAAAYLRTLSAKEGVEKHSDPETAAKRLAIIVSEQAVKNEKGRVRKRMNIAEETDEDILEKLTKVEEDLKPEVSSLDTPIDFMFDVFKIRMTVCPPTRRRIDPPNLYPTLKALIDGLTDASWWDDDNFTHLLEVSFRYGGLSGEKDIFRIILDIEEIYDTSDFILETEISERQL